MATLRGVDIYSLQGEKGFTFDGKGIDFAFIKTTDGTTYLNPYAAKQIKNAKANGVMIGVYHFGSSEDVIKQAEFFVKKNKTYIKNGAIPVLDYETTPTGPGITIYGPSGAKKFMDYVYKQTGVRCMIYMNKSYTNSYNWKKVQPYYKLWGAQYADEKPGTWKTDPWQSSESWGPWGKKPTIYQYEDYGYIPGYKKSYLDLDIFYGSKSDFEKLSGKTSTSSTAKSGCSDKLTDFVKQPISYDFGLSIDTIAKKCKSRSRFKILCGGNIDKVKEILTIAKNAGMSPALFAAYEINEGYNSADSWLNALCPYPSNVKESAKKSAQAIVSNSKVMDEKPAWIDVAHPLDFVPASVKKSGNAEFKKLIKGSIGRGYISSTSAATWEVYYPQGLKASVNGVMNYATPLKDSMNTILSWGGTFGTGNCAGTSQESGSSSNKTGSSGTGTSGESTNGGAFTKALLYLKKSFPFMIGKAANMFRFNDFIFHPGSDSGGGSSDSDSGYAENTTSSTNNGSSNASSSTSNSSANNSASTSSDAVKNHGTATGKVAKAIAKAQKSSSWNSMTPLYSGGIGGHPGIDVDGEWGAQCFDLGTWYIKQLMGYLPAAEFRCNSVPRQYMKALKKDGWTIVFRPALKDLKVGAITFESLDHTAKAGSTIASYTGWYDVRDHYNLVDAHTEIIAKISGRTLTFLTQNPDSPKLKKHTTPASKTGKSQVEGTGAHGRMIQMIAIPPEKYFK